MDLLESVGNSEDDEEDRGDGGNLRDARGDGKKIKERDRDKEDRTDSRYDRNRDR